MNKPGITLNNLRRICQFSFLICFLFLFLKTDYTGQDKIQYAVNILFRLDPFLALCASLGAGYFIGVMWPSIIIIFLTLFTGRSFCGWICPMGTIIDCSHRFIKSGELIYTHLRPIKYYLLAFLTLSSLTGFPVYGYFDPFSILVRSLALSIHPTINHVSTSFFSFTYNYAPEWINIITEPIYALMKVFILPFRQTYFELSLLSLFILLVVLLLGFIEQRFFCKNICPLGALLSIISKFSFLRGKIGLKCGKCNHCSSICPMGALDNKQTISSTDCNLCMNCVAQCPGLKISFGFFKVKNHNYPINYSRRVMTCSILSSLILPFFLHSRTIARETHQSLIRPPGAQPEDLFTNLCVRCGECMKVCIGNGLQPSFLESGIEGIFTPKLNARIGYCEYNCTLCGQVCPTGAIENISLMKKQSTKIGHAYFDKNICLPHTKGIPCIVCEEHCPTPKKAIKFRIVTILDPNEKKIIVKQPYIIDSLCIGCGICEHKCPLPGKAAIRLTSDGESRNPRRSIPSTGLEGRYY